MKIPTEFELNNILKKTGELPPPKRPRVRKCDLFSEPSRFKHIDEHVQKVCNVSHRSFRGLLWHLLFSNKTIKSELDKVRTIYRWTATCGGVLQKFENNHGSNTAEDFVQQFQSGRVTHAQIIHLFCQSAGLPCKIITGLAKGRTFRPGDTFSETKSKFRHCWNAVFFDSNWFLLDAKWGGLNGNNNSSELSEFYFLTEPDQLQFSHWAEEPRWQLVDRPIAINEFENYPFVKPHFFKVGMNFISNVKCVIETKRGQVKWDLGVTHPAKFCYRLVCASDGKDNVGGIPLKNFIFHEVQNGRATFVLRSPNPGNYYLKIFAKNLQERNGLSGYTRMMEVLEYKVQIGKTCIEDDPLPNCWDTTWGPGVRTEKFCLYPLQKRGLINTDKKAVEIEINKTRPVNILCRLCRNGWKESELRKCIKIDDNDTKAYVTATLPASGEYGLEIYGCIPTRKENGYEHVCQYLVNCTRRDEDDMSEDMERFLDTTDSRERVVENGDIFHDASDQSESFQLPEITIDESKLPEPKPRLTYNPLDKEKGWTTEIESHVKMISDKTFRRFDQILWELVFSKNIQDDTTKARVLFHWLATMRPQNLTFDSVDIGSPEETLRGLQTQRTTYAMAFSTLCRYTGLPCKVIFGVAKGMDYKPGQSFVPGSNHHTWNAVLLNDVWELVDTRFARRPILSNMASSSGNVEYELDNHFFMTNPQQFIYTHFPDESKWQMLDPSATMETFCNMPVMTPHFFALGLDLLSNRHADVHSSGTASVSLKYPPQKKLHFTFSVHADDGSEDFNGTKLNRYAMLEACNGTVSFSLRLPKKGTYAFFTYAKGESLNKTDMFAQVCEYRIVQNDILSPLPDPFPPCAYQSWGPGVAFYQYDLSTEATSAIIKTQNGVGKFEIESPKQMQFRTRLVQHSEAAEFEGYVALKISGSKTCFSVTAPGKGEYGLEIYAKDPDAESKKMRHVAQYLIICDEDIETIQLPKLPSGFLGLQPMLVKYGVITKTHSDPVIHSDTNFLKIQFETSQSMRFTTSMFETESKLEYSDYVFIQSESNAITLLVTLPKTGFFTLCVHGNLLTDNSQQIPGLYNYLIHCKNMTSPVIPYPKQYGYWKEGCFMMEPLAISPPLDTVLVPFRVRIPRATTVAVVVNKDWTPLNHNEADVWEGDIQLESVQENTKVVLVASYGDDQSKYATLLEYNI